MPAMKRGIQRSNVPAHSPPRLLRGRPTSFNYCHLFTPMKSCLAVLLVLFLVPSLSNAQTVQQSDVDFSQACTALGSSLEGAQAAFSAECPWRVRQVCDVVSSGSWACSTEEISASTSILDGVATGSDQTASPVADNGSCTAFGSDIGGAQTAFSAECPFRVRETCEPVSSGGWACSTASLGNAVNDAGSVVADVETSNPVADSTPLPATDNGVCTSLGADIGAAQSAFSAECPFRARNFCEPLTTGGWACSTASIAASANVFTPPVEAPVADNANNSNPTAEPDEPQDNAGAENDAPVASGPDVVRGTGVLNATYQRGDLILIAHDSGPDTDDMQAIVANRVIMDANPAANFILVGATQGHQWLSPTVGSEAHTQSLFPQWINAKASTSGTTSFDGNSIIEVANNVESTLNNDGTVHIAEGGPSDFTAEVLRLLQSRGVQSSDLKRIRVVQHSAGATAFNQVETRASNLNLVRSVATWVPIANGNVGGNGTADFQEPAGSGMCQRFMNNAANSRYASQWAWAYSQIGDLRKCDQSDSVELLHILNDTSTRTFDQFTSRYM